MSWLNFNDSLSSLKGQITNFANTVLAEDLLENRTGEDLKESESKCENEASGNEYSTEDSWTWSAVESKTDQLKTDETITNLKKKIQELQNENRDLIASLDQLDQNHQQNTEELVKMKSKLSEELEIVTEKYEILNMKYNKLALAENGYKKKLNELKNKCEELKQQKPSDSLKKDDIDFEAKYDLLKQENSKLKSQISILETSQKEKEKIEESISKLALLTSCIDELKMENKALKIALQTTTQDNENKQKYESEVEQLKSELEDFKHEKSETNEPIHEVNKLNNVNIEEQRNDGNVVELQKLNEEIIRSREENKIITESFEKEMNKLQFELEKLKSEKDIENSYNINQLMVYETKIDELENKLDKAKKEIKELEKNYSDLQNIKQDLEESKFENENSIKHYEEQISKLQEELSNKLKIEEKESENQEAVLKQFFHTFGEEFKDFLSEEESFPDHLDNIQVTREIFSKTIKNIHETISSFRQKIGDLETTLNNKNDAQIDKDEEIERLVHNSEILTQELSRKTKEIKDIEEECSELMKNNELLISKLNELKETGLQTIFESNEDNVASMEKQLDDDIKRIEELEILLAQKEIENKQINDRIIEEVKGVDSNEELIRDLKVVKEEKDQLKAVIEELKDKLRATESERDNCRAVIDKMRQDFETTEYQFSEMNVNLETLSEEIEKHKMRIDLLVSENEILKSKRQEDSKNDEELKVVKQELIQTKHSNEILLKELKKNEEKQELKVRETEEMCEKLRSEIDKIIIEKTKLEQDLGQYKEENEGFKTLYNSLFDGILSDQVLHGEESELSKITDNVNEVKEKFNNLQEENSKLLSELETIKIKSAESETNEELQNLIASRNELIAIVQTKHQETLTYHAEIQRLSEILKQETEKNIKMETEIEMLRKNSCPADALTAKNEEIEKLKDQVDFLRQKCDVISQSLLEEQQRTENEKSMSSEKEAGLSKKLERLQSHLMEVEEHYTQELLQSEQKIALLQARLNEVEKREKDSSTIYTSVSIRANQQNEALTQQLQSMTSQRDEFRKKLLDLEDENNVKSAALSNLQLVLEQFQRDKEADVIRETDRIRRQVKHEQTIQEDLRKEIANLENQIKESKQGLQAALRLTDQLEMSKNQISGLREEVSVLSDKLQNKEEELKAVTSQTDGKVDKSLVKNLIIGFVTSNKNLNKDQKQILKIIATVLDFNEQDHNKVNLNQAHQNTWLHSLLSPMAGDDNIPPNESLSRAFVNFLENESKPRVIPSLVHQSTPSESSSSVTSSSVTTPTPIVLNEIVLPTFSDFPQHRNSSSILKGVLKDNS